MIVIVHLTTTTTTIIIIILSKHSKTRELVNKIYRKCQTQ